MADRVEIVIAGRDAASGRHDVIVLDAGAVGRDECFEKLRRCAASDAQIGTVVPWSAATLAPQETDVDIVNAALDRASPRIYPDFADDRAPCMYIKAEALSDAGGAEMLRDPASLQSRVRAAGYRNVLCDDAYAGALVTEAPLQGAPRALAPIARLARTQIAIETQPAKPGILHVLHSRGGGTEKYVQSVVAASQTQFRHYFLRVAPDRWLFKDAIGEHGAACEWPRDAAGEDCLRIMCAWLAIDFVHLHSLVGSGDDLVRMLAKTALPYCYSVHDMYAPCPTVYLIDASGKYCNATTDLAACSQCLAQTAAFRDIDIGQWRARYATLLRGAAKVYAPSRWAGDTLRNYYPEANIEIRPHPVAAERMSRQQVFAFELPQDACRHVAVLGAIGPEKGSRVIDALADEIRKRSLPLRVVVVGFTDRARRWQSEDRTLTIHGSYGPDELAALFERYRIDVVVFPTIWPETFSYTLSEAWRAGRPALVPPRGALAERVQATGAGWLMREWPDVAGIADELVEITSGARVAELRDRSRLARAAAQAEAIAGTTVPYEDITRCATRPKPDAATLHEIYAAACRAMSVVALPPRPSPEAAARPSPLTRLLRLVRA
jgi:glycosyltransferase involved in cell wall biosynthesis